MLNRTKAWITAAAAAVLLPQWACAEEGAPSGCEPLAEISGVTLFAENCTLCHGPDGKGDTKMGKKLEIKDFTDAKYQAGLKEEEMLKAIKQGVKDGEKLRMKAAEGLNDEEMKALVAYVRTFKK